MKKLAFIISLILICTMLFASCGKAESQQESNGLNNQGGSSVKDLFDEYDNNSDGDNPTSNNADDNLTDDNSDDDNLTDDNSDDDKQEEDGYNGSDDAQEDGSDVGELESVFDDDDIIDLTTLSATMVYAEVYNIMSDPQGYTGREIKMTGQYVVYEEPDNNKIHNTCIIFDALACCQQGIEFDLGEGAKYPEVGELVTIKGTFSFYNDGMFTYCMLKDADIVK